MSNSYPKTRHMSAQAWRRLRKQMTDSELEDLAKDLSALLEASGGLTDEQQQQLAFGLTGFNWEAQKQL